MIESLFPLAGGGLLGFGVGYLLKKMAKITIIILGAIALLIGFLEYHRLITVNWTAVETQTQLFLTNMTQQVSQVTTQMGHEIPIGMGLIGFIPGLILGLAKG